MLLQYDSWTVCLNSDYFVYFCNVCVCVCVSFTVPQHVHEHPTVKWLVIPCEDSHGFSLRNLLTCRHNNNLLKNTSHFRVWCWELSFLLSEAESCPDKIIPFHIFFLETIPFCASSHPLPVVTLLLLSIFLFCPNLGPYPLPLPQISVQLVAFQAYGTFHSTSLTEFTKRAESALWKANV